MAEEAAREAISDEEVAALLEKNGNEDANAVRPYDFSAQRINRTQLPLFEEISKNFAERTGPSLSGLLGRAASMQFDSLESVKSADLQASLPVPASLAVVRLKPLSGLRLRQRRAGTVADPAGRLLRRVGPRHRRSASGRRSGGAALPRADGAQFRGGSGRRVAACHAAGTGTREAGDQPATGAVGRPVGIGRRRQIHRGVRGAQRPHRLAVARLLARADSRDARRQTARQRPRASRKPGRRC